MPNGKAAKSRLSDDERAAEDADASMRRYVRGDSVQRVWGDGTDRMVDEAERRDAKEAANTHDAADVCGIAMAIENAPRSKSDDKLKKSLSGYSKNKNSNSKP